MMELISWEDLKDEVFGAIGTESRDELERESENFLIGVLILQAREDQKLTQAQLAERIGIKREYISRVENDANNITLKSLRKIVEQGLGGKLRIEIDFDAQEENSDGATIPKKNGAKKQNALVAEKVH